MEEPKQQDNEEFTLGEALSEAPEETLRDLSAQTPLTLSEAYQKALDERYAGLVLTRDEKVKVQRFMVGMRLGGSAGLPLICAEHDCDYKNACPLYELKVGPPKDTGLTDRNGRPILVQDTKAPYGEPCPLEQMAVMDARNKLTSYIDVEVDTNHPVIMSHVNELAQIAALEWRCNMKLAYDFHGMTQEVPAAVSPQGEVYTRKEINPAVEMLEKLSQRRSRLLKEIVMTPEAQYKKQAALKETKGDSLSRRQAAAMEALREAEAAPVKQIPEHVTTGVIPDDDPQPQESGSEAAQEADSTDARD